MKKDQKLKDAQVWKISDIDPIYQPEDTDVEAIEIVNQMNQKPVEI